MGQPFVGEIRIFAGSFPPVGWLFCDGQLLPISENDVLFTLIGTTYGGDGQETFALPDLRGRIPMHVSSNFPLAQSAGQEEVTLTVQQIPVHSHPVLASTNAGDATQPQNNLLASNPSVQIYRAQDPVAPMNASAVGPTGGSQPHTNMQPYLCVNYIISLFGIFPHQ